MAWWIWVLIALALLAAEFASTTMHIAFFAIGALVVAVLDAMHLGIPLWGELLIFTMVSLFALLVFRPLLIRKLKLDRTPVVDTMVGEQAVAMETIAPAGLGKAEMRGTTWNARNSADVPITPGMRLVVERIEGLVLFVRPQ
jgi:membrane protein implicated in regulation of membrane protease activity